MLRFMPTIALPIPYFPRSTWISGRRRNLNTNKNKPRLTMLRMNDAGKGKEWFGKSMKLSIYRPKMDMFSPIVKIDETSEFEEFVACEARLNEEYWAAAWLRAECHWENRENERNAENLKWLFAEKEFVSLKKRCNGKLGEKYKCILMVKKEDGSELVDRVVGTLALSIRYFPQGQTFPEENVVAPRIGAMDRRVVSKSDGYISNLCVAKSARRRGVATTMLQHAISTAHHHGIQRLFLHVTEDNEAALGLYQKLGFKLVEAVTSKLFSVQLLLLCFEASS